MLAAQHVVDVAGALGRERGEQEPIVVGLLQQVINGRLHNRHFGSIPFVTVQYGDEFLRGALEIVVHDDLVVAVTQGHLAFGGVETELEGLRGLGAAAEEALAPR